MFPLLFLFLILFDSPGMAADFSGIPLSQKVEDRRPADPCSDSSECAQKVDMAAAKITQFGKKATENSFPFFCAAFKETRSRFVGLGNFFQSSRSHASYVRAISREIQMASTDPAGSANICKGARQEQALRLKHASHEVELTRKHLIVRYGEAGEIAEDLQRELEKYPNRSLLSSIRDFNSRLLNRNCESARNLAIESLQRFRQFRGALDFKLLTLERNLKASQIAITAIKCE